MNSGHPADPIVAEDPPSATQSLDGRPLTEPRMAPSFASDPPTYKSPVVGLTIRLPQTTNKENIDIDPEAIEFTLRICNGSTKLLINYLEKFALLKQSITFPVVNTICTNIYFDRFDTFTSLAIIEKNFPAAVRLLYTIYEEGYSVMDILDSYFTFIKITDMLTEDIKYRVIKLILKYIALFHTLHENEIELALFTNELLRLL